MAHANDRTDVSRPKKPLDAILRRLKDGCDGRRHQHMRNEDGEILDAILPGAPDRHGVGWGGGFKTDSEKHHFLIRVCPSDFQTVERRIDDAHIRAL